MIEPDIMVDKRGPLILWVLFDREECDQVLEDRGIKVMGPIQRETIKTDGDVGGNGGSHVQEAFGRRPKMEGLIFPGNNPERIMPDLYNGVPQGCGRGRSSCGKKRSDCGRKIHAAAQHFRAGGGVRSH